MSKITLSADELNMIQTLRNAQALTGNTTANDGASSTSSSRTHKVQPVYQVITRGRHAFESQLVKDGNTKRTCLKVALIKSSALYPDPLRFSLDFHTERERLVDSKSFCDACRTLNLVPEYVADHVVFEGKSKMNTVLRDGLQALGDRVRMFNTPLWEDDEKLFLPAAEVKEAPNV